MTAGQRSSGTTPERYGRRPMAEATLSLATPDGDMGVHVVRPDGDGPFPVIVFFHHGPGLDDGSKQSMQSIADEGYYVISHDRYHRETPWSRCPPESRPIPRRCRSSGGLIRGTTEDDGRH